jgi:hypothetical protein
MENKSSNILNQTEPILIQMYNFFSCGLDRIVRNFDEDIIKRLIILLKIMHLGQYLQNIGSIHWTNNLLFDFCQPEFPPFISFAQQIK